MSNRFLKKKRSLLAWIIKNKTNLCFNYALPSLNLIEFLPPEVRNLPLSRYTENPVQPEGLPSLKNLSLQSLHSLQQACTQKKKPRWLSLWAEKLLRVCEVRRQDLQARICLNLNTKDSKTKTLRLCLFFLNCFYIYNDARYVNIVLKIKDLRWLNFQNPNISTKANFNEKKFLKILITLFIEDAIRIISSNQWSTEVKLPFKFRQINQIHLPMRKLLKEESEVIIFSPNPFGATTLCIAELLKLHGVKIKAIVVRRLFNINRLLQEVKRDGLKWVLRKITHKLLFKKKSYQNCSFETIADYAQKINLKHNNVSQWCRDNNTEYIVCNTLNDSCVHDYLAQAKPKLVVFAGGGILKEKTLELSGDGVLNCHGGTLPHYRGLDLNEWPLLEKHGNLIGCSTHFMSKYVDEGDLFYLYSLDIKKYKTIDQIIKLAEVSHVKLIVYTVINHLQNTVKAIPQDRNEGKQFFYMHPKLAKIAQDNLEATQQHLS